MLLARKKNERESPEICLHITLGKKILISCADMKKKRNAKKGSEKALRTENNAKGGKPTKAARHKGRRCVVGRRSRAEQAAAAADDDDAACPVPEQQQRRHGKLGLVQMEQLHQKSAPVLNSCVLLFPGVSFSPACLPLAFFIVVPLLLLLPLLPFFLSFCGRRCCCCFMANFPSRHENSQHKAPAALETQNPMT